MLARRWLINLVLFAVALALALAARLEHTLDLRDTTLTLLSPNAIQALSLQRPGEPAIRLRRDDDGWRMLAPFAAPAADAPIDKLLPIANAFVHRSIPAAAVDLQQLGLDPARISLRLDDLELRFGTTEPIAERRYVQVGDMVHLIDDDHLPELLASAEHYIARRLLPADFSPALGSIDGRPLTADAVAGLTTAEAMRVEPLSAELGGRVLTLESADGGRGLRFLIAAGGTSWSRLDQRLSYIFARPPLAEVDEDAAPGVGQPFGRPEPIAPSAPSAPSDPMRAQTLTPVSDAELLDLRPPSEPGAGERLPSPAAMPMPTKKLSP